MSLGSPPREIPLAPHQIVRSPEQVALELPIAGPTSRIFAFLIDFSLMTLGQLVIAGALIYVMASAFDLGDWLGIGENGSFRFDAQIDEASGERILLLAQAIFILVEFLVQWGYFVCCEMLMQGRSPGKAYAGLRVVRDGGLPIGFRESALRNLVRAVDMLPTAYVIGFVSMLISAQGKRLGDFAAGTLVVREDRPQPALPLRNPPESVDTVFRFDRGQLRAVGAAERRLIRQTLRRLDGLSEDRRAQALARATEVLRARMEYPEEIPPGTQYAFLVALLRAAEEA